MMKRLILAVVSVVCLMLLVGCVPLAVNMQQEDNLTQLPIPAAPLMEPVQGDAVIGSSRSVSLYVVSDDQLLVPVERVLPAVSAEQTAEEAIRALLNMDSPVGASLPFPEGTHLLSLQRSGNVAVVDLSIEARSVSSEQQLLWMRSAIAATLMALDEVEYVSVLIAGRDEGLLDLPSCAADHVEKDLSAAWTRLSAEKELLTFSETDAAVERTAILYYPTKDGNYIAPVARTVRITEKDMIMPLIDALISPDGQSGDCLRSPFPQGSQVMTAAPKIVVNEDGEQLVQLSFDSSLIAVLEREGLSAWQLYASLTYTITGFVPDVDGLVIYLGDGVLSRTERNGQEILFSDGRMSRRDYPQVVCNLQTAYMGAADGTLAPVTRTMMPQAARSPRQILSLLFDGPQPWDGEVLRVMPGGVSANDILGIRISAGEAVVNLSSNFYRCGQSLTAQQERMMIYSIVNTLTEMSGVKTVRFQVEGETVDHLTGTVFLRGALMRNTGIIQGKMQQDSGGR